MEREIKFRGKRVDIGQWIYGSLIRDGKTSCRIVLGDNEPGTYDWYEVVPESVGQLTGLSDKNGREIYEGDILRIPPKDDWEKTNYACFEVFWHDNDSADRHIGFQLNRVHLHGALAGYGGTEAMLPKWTKQMDIIGNIFETPELLR